MKEDDFKEMNITLKGPLIKLTRLIQEIRETEVHVSIVTCEWYRSHDAPTRNSIYLYFVCIHTHLFCSSIFFRNIFMNNNFNFINLYEIQNTKFCEEKSEVLIKAHLYIGNGINS